MIQIGIDYYPEQWDCDMWEKDCADMAAVGTKTVRIGEFAWSRLEPKEGEFDFAWLDNAISVIKKHGMKVILGTPTNCAPLWLYKKYPETLQCERDGRRTHTYMRGHRCMTSPIFRKYAGRIVRLLAERYAGRPEIFAWQIDNEIESNHCTCPSCAAAFRAWVMRKYGTLERVNAAWGMVVWSGEFSEWDEIRPFMTSPGNFSGWYNPAYLLDYERFCSWSTADYVRFQADIIRKCDPSAVITTNACFGDRFQNFQEEFAALDVAGYDNYPPAVLPSEPEALYSNAFVLDLVRGFKQKKFWVLEQLGGPMGCWGPIRPAMEQGMLEGYALQAVAHGADLLSFFRWRTAASGAEMFCYGLLDHDNQPNRRLRELERLSERLSAIPELSGTELECRVAMVYSADQEYSFRLQYQSEGFAYWTQLRLFHDACMNLGVNLDIIPEDAPLDTYRVVIVPACFVAGEAFAARLEAFAEAGGTVVVTNRSGVKDENGNCRVGEPLPTVFRRLCGCRVIETDAIGGFAAGDGGGSGGAAGGLGGAGFGGGTGFGGTAGFGGAAGDYVAGRQRIRSCHGGIYAVSSWCDLIELEGAESVAEYQEKYYARMTAVARNHFGNGFAYYVGTVGEKALYRSLLHDIFLDAGVDFIDVLPQGVESTVRSGETGTYRFFFNNTMRMHAFSWEGRHVELQPLEVKILTEQGVWV